MTKTNLPEPRPGTITEVPGPTNGYSYVVETAEGGRHYLRGMGAPQGASVGDRGRLVYQCGASFGLWMWEASR